MTPVPESHQDLHAERLEYLKTIVEWLTLELEYDERSDGSKQDQANAMIPEINARAALFSRAINNIEFIYNL